MRTAIRNPCAPELGVRCLGDGVQVWNHRGTIWAFMADAAIRIVKLLAELALALIDVATGAITAENRLPVHLCSHDVLGAVNTSHAIGRRVNGDFDGERFRIRVRAYGDGFGKRAALGGDVDLDSDLTVSARRDDPRQRRQLRRGATARRMDAQDGDVGGRNIGEAKSEMRFACTRHYVCGFCLGIPIEICV